MDEIQPKLCMIELPDLLVAKKHGIRNYRDPAFPQFRRANESRVRRMRL